MTTRHGFENIQEREIPELNTKARLFRHIRTGAQLLSLENRDENKVFAITFRTPPSDGTGIAHIMEHSVLCGSQKYPVKEPFVELLKGSLNTFLNAFTFPDKTCYPIASQNLQDFYNLIDVYVDAVFHPLIPAHILQQEGWHYELESLDGPLTYKGVVFNEMKGAYSNPDDVLQEKARMSLFPDTPYGVNSGGDPRQIPDLTYEDFKAFHDKFYHPSNARIVFYGDDDPDERLRRMDGYLQEYQAMQVDSAIQLQPRFEKPRRLEVSYDPGEGEEGMKGQLVINWLLPETTDPQTRLGLSILAHILVGTPASPLRKTLIDSGYGEDLAGVGLESELRQSYFSTGLKGVVADANGRLEKGAEVEELILGTLEKLAKEGIDPDTVAASLNTVEFQLRENNTGSFPRGLLLALRSLTSWLYDGDPFTPLAFEKPLADIKESLSNGGKYFEGLMRQYFLTNPHRTIVTLKPEAGLGQKVDKEEKECLEKQRLSMSKEQLQAIMEQARRLKKIQETPDTPEALATLPGLKLADLDKENKRIPLAITEVEGSKIFYHDLFTNGIVYLDMGFDLHALPQELLPYVALFSRALVDMGTQKEDFVRLSQRIGRSTGGIWPALFTSLIRGTEKGATWLFLRGKSTTQQAEELLAILQDILLTVRLDDVKRFRQLVLEDKAETEASLVPGGHRVVNTRLRALFNESDWAEEQIGGLSQLFFLRDLAPELESNWTGVLERLESIRKILLNRRSMICNVTLDAANWAAFEPRLAGFLQGLPAAAPVDVQWRPTQTGHFEGLTIPAQVNYVGKGANLFKLGYEARGSVDVILNYLRNTYLWERVRVQGGAYGAYSIFSNRSGVFTYLSYRDPNLLKTLDNYDGTASFLQQLELSQEELTKSIIGVIGDLDAYQLPDAKGYTSMARYLAGDTDESRQLWRDQVLNTSVRDFRSFGEVLERVKETGYVVVLGSPDALAKANAEGGNWLEVKKVL